MSRLLMSNSEVQAICRNRSEQRNLSDKLDKLDHVAFQSKDAIQQDLNSWRKFRRENVKNSGWSPRSVRPDPGEDVFFPLSFAGRPSGSTPGSPTHSKDTAMFTKPWAYSYSPNSHNRGYREMTKAPRNHSKKPIDVRLRSASFDGSASTEEEQQPALLRHVKTAQALSKAASVLAPAQNKRLTLRQNDTTSKSVPPLESCQTAVVTTKRHTMAISVSTVQTINEFSSACKTNKSKSNSCVDSKEIASSTLMKSVNAMKGLVKSRDIFTCFKCGKNVDNPNPEERFPQVALAYKGLHRAQTILKLSTHQNDASPGGDQTPDVEKPRRRRCCAKCQSNNESASKSSTPLRDKPSSKNQTKLNAEKKESKSYVKRRRASFLSANLSADQMRRLQVAKEKVSKCFEIPCQDEKTKDLEIDKSEMVSSETNLKSEKSDEIYLEMFLSEENTESQVIAIDNSDSDRLTRNIAHYGSKRKKESQQNLSEAVHELDLNRDDLEPDIDAIDRQEKCLPETIDSVDSGVEHNKNDEECPSDISHQQVMKVIQEEVIDKLNKLSKDKNSPPRLRKFSTLSRASTVFRLGGQRKKRANKTSGIAIFTKIAKHMLFEVWRRRKERQEKQQREEIANSSQKISQANFRAKYLSLATQNFVDDGSEERDTGLSAEAERHVVTVNKWPDTNRFQVQGQRKLSFAETSLGDICSALRNRRGNFPNTSRQPSHGEAADVCPNSNNTIIRNCDNNGNEIVSDREQTKRQVSFSTKRLTAHGLTLKSDINGNSVFNQCRSTNPKCSLNDNDNHNKTENAHEENGHETLSLESSSASVQLQLALRKRQKPPWMAGNDSSSNPFKPDVYHRGVRLSNYVCPEKRYLTAKRKNGKKELSVRWHSSVGAMVNKHEVSQDPMMAEKTFPKQARHRALHKMIENNHAPAPDDASKIHNEMLNSRIQDFLHSVEHLTRK